MSNSTRNTKFNPKINILAYGFSLILNIKEMNTVEKYNTTATVRINVMDGDDQYPHFLPCSPVSEHTICTNPLYTANISEDVEVTFTGIIFSRWHNAT